MSGKVYGNLLALVVISAATACASEEPAAETALLYPTYFTHDESGSTVQLLLGFSRDDLTVYASSESAGASNGELARNEDGYWVFDFGPEVADGDGRYDQYVITFDIATSDGASHYVVVDRQSPAELMEAFNVDKVDGYSVIARSSLDFTQGARDSSYGLIRNLDYFPEDLPTIETEYEPNSEMERVAQTIV